MKHFRQLVSKDKQNLLKMMLQLAIKMVFHVNVLLGHPPFQPVNALIMNDRIQGLVTTIRQ